MLSEMKKKSLKSTILIMIVPIIIGVILIAISAKDTLNKIKGPEDITNASISEIKDTEYAEIELDMNNVYGCFLQESTSDSKQYYYWLVLVGDNTEKRYMAIKLSEKYDDLMAKIEDEYTELDNGNEPDSHTVLPIKGKIEKMKGDVYTNFVSFSKEYGYQDEDIPFVTLNLVINGNTLVASVVLSVIGIILVIGSVIVIMLVAAGFGQRKLKKRLENKGPGAVERAEYDFNNAAAFGKNVRIGKDYTFVLGSFTSKIIDNREIVWAYMNKIHHRTNGISTGTTYSVLVFDVHKNKTTIPMKYESTCNDMLSCYGQITDTIVLGYNKELLQLFRGNLNEFLNITYTNHIYGQKEQQY